MYIYLGFVIFLVLFYFNGRGFLLLLNYIIFKKRTLPSKILKTKTSNLYPIFGSLFIGNILIILNYFFPLKNNVVFLILFLSFFPNFLKIEKLNLNIKFQNFFGYLFVPAILTISSFNTGWHYDAGFYHLNQQNWLRDSEMIFGMVNIHWAFGMSSIAEYISAILWLEGTFINLHYLNLMYIFSFYNILVSDLSSKELIIRNSSIMLLIFSIFDNFGLNGGRNGFIYIQGVGKQDVSVAILFFFIARTILLILNDRKFNKFEVNLLSLLTLFTIQIKLSSVFLIFLMVYFYWFILRESKNSFKTLLYINIPSIFFGFFWILKQYLTTGCFIYPVNATCINTFTWYSANSTKAYEEITRNASYSLSLYDYDILLWLQEFMSFKINQTVTFNGLLSLLIIYSFSRVFYYRSNLNNQTKIVLFVFLIGNFIYLVNFGPTPRYLMGFILTSAYSIGLFSGKSKIGQLNIGVKNILVIFSVVLVIRSTSYIAMINQNSSQLFDPRPIAEYVLQENGWLKPDTGDQCWINLECTMSTHEIEIVNRRFYKAAYRN